MRKQTNYLLGILVLICIVAGPQHSKDAKSEEPGELKLELLNFQVKKNHRIVVRLDWGKSTAIGDNTAVNRVKGEGKDAAGSFTYVVTRVANPEWTEYSLWMNYDSGQKKNQSLRLRWVTNGHEPPDNSEVTEGVWTFGSKTGKLSGKVN
ncbi:MAG: hypothetical protein U1F27_03825 [Turneriella sp.]